MGREINANGRTRLRMRRAMRTEQECFGFCRWICCAQLGLMGREINANGRTKKRNENRTSTVCVFDNSTF
jgi:hypothetical protein